MVDYKWMKSIYDDVGNVACGGDVG